MLLVGIAVSVYLVLIWRFVRQALIPDPGLG